MKKNPTILILLSAGSGNRFNSTIPKQYSNINNKSIILTCILNFIDINEIDYIQPVINFSHSTMYEKSLNNFSHSKLFNPIFGGNTRGESVLNGLKNIASYNPYKVLIHDCARVYPNKNTITTIINSIEETIGIIPALPINDTMVKVDSNYVSNHINRTNTYYVQTPQGFIYKEILTCYEKFQSQILTDDSSYFLQNPTHKVKIIEGDILNNKITTQNDLIIMEKLTMQKKIKVGQGIDIHEFSTSLTDNQDLYLGGIKIPHSRGLKGHSDADVILHSLVDAIFGVLNCGDIGDFFPPSNPSFKGMRSTKFLEFAYTKLQEKSAIIMNIDITLLAQEPKISTYKDKMRETIANILNISIDDVNIKATTTEHLGFVGRSEGIVAFSTICVQL